MADTAPLVSPASSPVSDYGSLASVAATEEADFQVQFPQGQGSPPGPAPWSLGSALRAAARVELAGFLVTFAFGLHGVIQTNLVIEKTCRVNLNLSDAVCDDIGHHEQEQNLVQQSVTDINLYFTFLSSIPCILISLFIGPLSDKYGRRPLLLIPLLGFTVCQCVYLLNIYFWDARADYILFGAVYSMFGGMTTFLIGLYSYVADTSSQQSRTARVSVVDVALSSGYTIGNFLSAIVYESWGFSGAFGLTIAVNAVNFGFIFLCLPESRKLHDNVSEEDNAAADGGLCSKTCATLGVVFGARSGYTRAISLLLILCMVSYVATGSADINYLYTRKMFAWTEAEYTEVTTGITVLQTLCSLLLLPLLSYKLRVPDPALGIMATLSSLAAILGIAFAHSPTQYIIALVAGMLSPQVSTVIRSLLSKTVPAAELGAVYTVLGCLEAAIPLAASPLLTVIYNSSLASLPGAVYLAEAGFMLLDLGLFLAVLLLLSLHRPYTSLHPAEPEADQAAE